MARDAALCVAAGAGELHIHPRAENGHESLSAVGPTVALVRRACPGTLVGVSTGAWIEADEARTRDAIGGWEHLPDYASVNLSEADAPAVMDLLRRRGVGVEAGLASVADAERLAGLADDHLIFRVLIEIGQQDLAEAESAMEAIAGVLARTGMTRPVLLHGFDSTIWHFAALARGKRWSARIGLEDGKHLPDGSVAPDNAAMVVAAAAVFRSARA
jgi:uncharacterized protein (DUF849 family)